MNIIVIIGNLTRDPEMGTVQTAGGPVAVCRFAVAVNNRRKKDEHGNPTTDYFNVTAWRGLAEIVGKYARKGKKVAVAGEVRTRTYEKDGVKHYASEIEASEVELLSPREDAVQPERREEKRDFEPVDDGEMPF